MRTSLTIFSLDQYFGQGKMNVESFLEYSSTLGFDGVDLGYYWRHEEEEIGLVPEWLRRNNLTLAAYIVRNDFAQVEERAREQVTLVTKAIERASQLKTKIVRIFVGDIKPSFPNYHSAKDILVSSLKNVCSSAESKGIILALENHGRLGAKTGQILDLLDEVNSPSLKLTVDIGTFLKVDEDPVLSVEKLAPLAVHAHIKDFRKKDGQVIPAVLGEGEVDLDGCLGVLKDKGYQGYLSLEYEAKMDSKAGVEEGLDVLKKSLQRIHF